MKGGELISGSIVSQTEYTLNLATSFGTITLSQREIEEILPDKHRIILKGGTQLVGVILDLDEFNLKLQTDDGTPVNIDMPQIVNIETYDYDRGEKAQQEFVEQNLQKQQAAQAAQQAARVTAQTGQVEAAGGLTFDSDIDQVFDAKKATVIDGRVITPSAQVTPTAQRPMTDEEAFIKGVKTGEISQQEYAQNAKKELASQKALKKPSKTKKIERNFSKYFAVQAGVMPLDLLLDNSGQAGYEEVTEPYDIGGSSIAVSSKFLWRIKESNLWLGPTLGIGNVPNASFEDKSATASPDNPTVDTSGQILTLGAAANYYLNPNSRFAFYFTASAAYEMLKLNYRGSTESHSITSNGFSGAAGIGVETWIDDVMLGIEARQVFAQRSKELKESASSNTLIQAQLSWKF